MSLPPINKKRDYSGNDAVFSRINKPNMDDLTKGIDTMSLEEGFRHEEENDEGNKLSREQQLILKIFSEYDDGEFHSMFYEDKASMQNSLRLFSKKGFYLDTMPPEELYEMSKHIDREKEPWKWNFLLQLASCKISPQDCFIKPEEVPAKRLRVYNKAGAAKLKKSRRSAKKSKINKTRRRKTY
jgi:hypothetical protein